MNKKVLVIICVVLVVLGIGLFFVLKPTEESESKKEIRNITYFSYSRDVSMAMNGVIKYSLDCDKICVASIKPDGVSEEDTKIVDVDSKFLKNLETILNKYKVIKWDGFDKSDDGVLDGRSFSLSIKYGNQDTISARGYMKWPDNYQKVRDELDDLFGALYK